ncbi:hypothetical protein IDM40_07465 [Nocardiopsis sp. HNM0947]|uniref:PE-PGRS family protein n=1 Tax=Nocardiopsis coralli TaxID=2772213 RepID=A0ABR9P3W0_9ACTN|nr:hypothetical protein [Nocardiopsis coralli]MBE2998539.1 hypothetical protein [Nocardiopsis coralli]
MEPLNRLYERLCEDGYTDAFEWVVLDQRLRSLLSCETPLRRVEDGDGTSTLPRLYTWAAEAGCEGEPGMADVMARWFLVRNSVHRAGGVTALIGAHRSAVEAHGGEGAAHLGEVVPAVVELLVEEGRTDEASALLAYLETAGDQDPALLGVSAEGAGALGRDTAERYVSAEAAALATDVDAIYADEGLRRRLLVLARVSDAFFAAGGPAELEGLREVFRANPRSFNALYWGDESTGALVEDHLRLALPGMRLHLEACRDRWFFDRTVRRARATEGPDFACTLLLSAALRSDQVARWLAREPATVRGGTRGVRVRLALFKARIPRRSLYAELLTQACADGTGAGSAEVGAIRGMVRDQVPVLWRSVALWAVLVPLWTQAATADPPWWWEMVLSVSVGVLLAVQGQKWRSGRSWFRSVLLPRTKSRAEQKSVWLLASELLVNSPWMYFSPLYSKAYLHRHLTPLWQAVAFRERVQADPMLASDVALRLGRKSIHSADDVSVLLARHLPRQRS